MHWLLYYLHDWNDTEHVCLSKGKTSNFIGQNTATCCLERKKPLMILLKIALLQVNSNNINCKVIELNLKTNNYQGRTQGGALGAAAPPFHRYFGTKFFLYHQTQLLLVYKLEVQMLMEWKQPCSTGNRFRNGNVNSVKKHRKTMSAHWSNVMPQSIQLFMLFWK